MAKISDYNKVGHSYVYSQDKFYATRSDLSRKAIFSRLGNVRNKKILEIGFGAGDDLRHLLRKGAQAYGIEKSKEMLAIAGKRHRKLKNISIQSFEKMNFKNNFFDVIISRFALHYSSNLKKGLNEICRVLKPKGVLLFLVPHPLVDFLAKKNKTYDVSEIIARPVFAENLILNYPTHTFSEYLGPAVLKRFELAEFYEEVNISDKDKETGFLVIKLIKKQNQLK